MSAHPVSLKRPVVTEKSLRLAGSLNQYTFAVDRRLNKGQIAEAVATYFGVTVEKVQTVNSPVRLRRVLGRRQFSKETPWKKAVVTLKEGDKIKEFSGGTTE